MKRALIYDPYLDTLGGGERYCLTFASALKSFGYIVNFAWPDPSILSQVHERFALDSDFVCDPTAHHTFRHGNLLSKLRLSQSYDLVFFVSDGSLPFLFSQKNLVHFQVPFTRLGGNHLVNLLKSLFVHQFVFNSNFTAAVIRRQLAYCPSTVLYPPIDTDSFVPGKKENVILSVARFDSPSHAKRQDVLIEAFAKFHSKNKDFKLVLAGGLKGADDFLTTLKAKAGKLPIEFVPNPDFSELKKLYAKSKFFWHAAGYGVNEVTNPEKVEHFGITTVEAMASGAVPIVINRGGQREIITSDTGYLCDSIDEMISNTLSLITSPDKLKFISNNAIQRTVSFGMSSFKDRVDTIIR